MLNGELMEAGVEIVQDVLGLLEHAFEEIFLLIDVMLIDDDVVLLRR